MDAKNEQDIGSLVQSALKQQPEPAQGDDDEDPLGVREEDFDRIAAAFGFSAERLAELLGSGR
jgi:hypothetical protein